jgi:hypothetical protein
MDSLLHKRHGFAAERELRILKFDEAHYSALVPKDTSVSELPEHIYVNWVLGDVIEEIAVSPYADVNYEELVRRDINAARFEACGSRCAVGTTRAPVSARLLIRGPQSESACPASPICTMFILYCSMAITAS